MGWAKFDDQFTEHPKVVAAGPMAELLAMRGVIYCARYETDGHIQAAQLPRLAVGISAARKQAAKLVEVGLWHVDPDGDGWWVHDFLDYHPSREDKERERAEARERMAKSRAKKKKKGSSGRSSEDVRPNTSGTNGRSSDAPYPTPTRTPREESKLSSSAPSPPDADEPILHDDPDLVRELTRELAMAVRGNGHPVPKQGTKAVTSWLVEMDRLVRIGPPGWDGDPPPVGEIRNVIRFATTDGFWKANIRSAGTFREKYPQLRIKAEQQHGDQPADVHQELFVGGVRAS